MTTMMTGSSVQCAPRWSTRRRYERPTWGPYWGRVARVLGRPYMPWQQEAADIAGEVDSRGRLCYNEIVITVPRQSGKTTLILSVVIGRADAGAAFGGRQRMLYAAQTREDARDKWKEDYLEDMNQVRAIRGRYQVRIANGSEKITWHSSRSTFGPIATKEKSGHGKVLDFGCLDEAFAQDDGSVEAAWLPAMITRPMAQFWVPSTAGTDLKSYFGEKVEAGRLVTEADIGTGMAYIEYSAPEDAPPDSPDVWRRCMPALGYTQEIEAIQREFFRMKLNDFKRAFLNQWVGKVTDLVIPASKWEACQTDEEESPRATRPVFSIDVSVDRANTCISMGAARPDGRAIVRVIDYRPGTGWVVDRIKELRDEYDPAAIIIDGAGPARSLLDDLVDQYIDPYVMTAQDMVAACGAFYDATADPADQGQRVAVYPEPVLDEAVSGAERRELGDAWAWTRKKSASQGLTDISPLVAVTSAYWGQTRFGDSPGDDFQGSYG